MKLIEKVFGTYSEREIKRIMPLVNQIEELESQMEKLSDEQLKDKTAEFKERLKNNETLDDILVEAFAVVREASKRVLEMRHYPVQLIGGIILHQGRIAEMRTGEGKTLVSTLPAYLNALEGKGVHIVTVNDYLATRDAQWMGEVHEFLGLTVGVITNGMENKERREAYNCDITYGTNNEYGFDYLRDNMVVYKEERVQRTLNFTIIDEVDSVLIDEARTPLIISGSTNKSTSLYTAADFLARRLQKGRIIGEMTKMSAILQEEIKEEGDFVVDEKAKSINLTDEGIKKVESYFKLENLADPENMEVQHHVITALKAHNLMHKDQDYVINDGEIVIVDEFTGRLMPGRRYSEGLHQAIEAKEGLEVRKESKTLATITFQNYFNKYNKKSGMTGTAQTEEEEFREIYNMDVIAIPTNKPVVRIDNADVVYKTKDEKYNAAADEIKEAYDKGQPVLVGTITIDDSEELSKLLKRRGVAHKILNAKFHEKEAEIVAEAGQKGAVTIATNMAGRGTDIKLGEGVTELGGLKIVGTERHESRRIDNQLRGRAGRQGDPGESRFYICLEDDLMRLFGSERLTTMFNTLKLPEGEPIQHKMLSNAIEKAQKKVEGNNFAIRKHLLEYDKVMNEQREIIYEERLKVLDGDNMRSYILKMIEDIVEGAIDFHIGEDQLPEEWDIYRLREHLENIIPFNGIELDEKEKETINKKQLIKKLKEKAIELYEGKEKEFEDPEQIREIERVVLLKVIDRKWMDHIDNMDQMRQGIGLRAYGQRDPLLEYRFAGYEMFDEMSKNIKEDTVKILFNIKVEQKVERERVAKVTSTNRGNDSSSKKPYKRTAEKVGRNDACPCGSGKKYKYCCGR
ncbi:protein translocase subunit secA [Natranaerovirga hydrolytica]|uniref:Protein translocase subunit SecA n=1 Tax=Natranaerovirga hydrolytica TaxID=680378 RepID=A0A4R1M9A3_9FIRM|nr:preprotein translocase subunit SecA [Natranaerovirga hydrolytica]TCK87950.1 protein translocase subunit secA [Natranaerovirga hydrolytica]